MWRIFTFSCPFIHPMGFGRYRAWSCRLNSKSAATFMRDVKYCRHMYMKTKRSGMSTRRLVRMGTLYNQWYIHFSSYWSMTTLVCAYPRRTGLLRSHEHSFSRSHSSTEFPGVPNLPQRRPSSPSLPVLIQSFRDWISDVQKMNLANGQSWIMTNTSMECLTSSRQLSRASQVHFVFLLILGLLY